MTDLPDNLCGPAFDPRIPVMRGRMPVFFKGGSGAPKETAAQKRTAKKQEQLLDLQLEQSKNPTPLPEIPVPDPVLPSQPPPSQTGADVVNAEQNARRVASRRRGTQSTLLAGNTGGYQPLGGGQTLLG